MCIAIPGRVVDIGEQDGTLVGLIEFDGVAKPVSLDLVPEAKKGDYVLVYAGFAREIVDPEEVQLLIQLNEEMAAFLAAEQ